MAYSPFWAQQIALLSQPHQPLLTQTLWQQRHLLSTKQVQVLQTWVRSGLAAALVPFSLEPPLLAGTFPLNLHTPTSDLDILLHTPAARLPVLALFLRRAYHACTRLSGKVLTARFRLDGLPVEVYAAPQRLSRQAAWRHLWVEAVLLENTPNPLAAFRAIRNLRQQGLKTEPAFALHFHLPGNPYQALYDLSLLPLAAIQQVANPPA